MVELRLYVLGTSATTFKLTERLNHLLTAEFQMEFSLEIVDILEHPELAEEDEVFATPMLVKKAPLPSSKRLFGEPEFAEKVMKHMGIL